MYKLDLTTDNLSFVGRKGLGERRGNRAPQGGDMGGSPSEEGQHLTWATLKWSSERVPLLLPGTSRAGEIHWLQWIQ